MQFQYLSNDGLTVSGNRFRRIRDVDMKHDFAFVVCINFLFVSCFLFMIAIHIIILDIWLVIVLHNYTSLFVGLCL